MSNASATGTVWNLPNYAGQLYTSTPAETPFLNLIAAKAVMTDNFQFPTGAEFSHETAAQPAITETASLTAPTAISYVRTQETNVTQIFQEKISVSYARMANAGRFSGVSSSAAAAETVGELEFQTARALEKIARDIEYTFINGAYQVSTGAGVANKTRGILAACYTYADLDSEPLTRAAINAVLADAYAAGATFTDTVLLCGAAVKQALTDAYSSQWGFSCPPTREIGGMNIMQIETDFGVMSVLLDRFVPAGTLIGADISCIRPVEQEVPGKGNFFREALSKTGAAEEYQIFGQLGLDHGPMWKHFKLVGIGSGESRTPLLVKSVDADIDVGDGDDGGENGDGDGEGNGLGG